jgi:hypothetical protein
MIHLGDLKLDRWINEYLKADGGVGTQRRRVACSRGSAKAIIKNPPPWQAAGIDAARY